MKRGWWLALAASAALGGCGGSDNSTAANSAATGAAEVPAEARLATLAAGEGGHARLSRVIAGAGMTEVLNGVGPYTLFAPTDEALETLGAERADALAGEAMRPQAVALLRAHLVPGTITRRDIETAVDAPSGRAATMRTLGGTMLTFVRDGDAITVSSDRGGRARLSGAERLAANGALHPVDGLLVPAQ